MGNCCCGIRVSPKHDEDSNSSDSSEEEDEDDDESHEEDSTITSLKQDKIQRGDSNNDEDDSICTISPLSSPTIEHNNFSPPPKKFDTFPKCVEETFAKDDMVEYLSSDKKWLKAIVNVVGRDEELVPYYTITVLETGIEKGTVQERLRYYQEAKVTEESKEASTTAHVSTSSDKPIKPIEEASVVSNDDGPPTNDRVSSHSHHHQHQSYVKDESLPSCEEILKEEKVKIEKQQEKAQVEIEIDGGKGASAHVSYSSPEVAPNELKLFSKNQQVEYLSSDKKWLKAIVNVVGRDEELVPYYTITVLETGIEKGTVQERLRPLPKEKMKSKVAPDQASSDKQNVIPFAKNDVVEYLSSDKKWLKAIVNVVGRDEELVPYYTITVLETGIEKGTVQERLRPLPKEKMKSNELIPSSDIRMKSSSSANISLVNEVNDEFIPTYEWQVIRPNQQIPAGLDISARLNHNNSNINSNNRSTRATTAIPVAPVKQEDDSRRARIPPVWRLKVWIEWYETTKPSSSSSLPNKVGVNRYHRQDVKRDDTTGAIEMAIARAEKVDPKYVKLLVYHRKTKQEFHLEPSTTFEPYLFIHQRDLKVVIGSPDGLFTKIECKKLAEGDGC
jgi:hypothetical protein